MRIRFTIEIDRARPDREEEMHPEGNNFTQAEVAMPTTEPELITGFQRNTDWG